MSTVQPVPSKHYSPSEVAKLLGRVRPHRPATDPARRAIGIAHRSPATDIGRIVARILG